METHINEDTQTDMIPVTIFIVEDSDLGDALRSHKDLASAALHDGHAIVRSGHIFSCHDSWSYGAHGVRVDSMQSYTQSLLDATSSKNDTICIVDCDLGRDIADNFETPFLNTAHLPDRLLRNNLGHPGLAFAKQILDHSKLEERFVFVAFANVTITETLLGSLKTHAAWQDHNQRFDCIPSLPGECDGIDDLRGAIARAIELFLNAKGYGATAEERLREGTADWFPPITQF